MYENKKALLENKLKEQKLKLYAREYIDRRILYHWLDILHLIQYSGIIYDIEYLCCVPVDEYQCFANIISELKNADLLPNKIKTDEIDLMDNLFEKYPTIDSMKYIMNLPIISPSNTNFSELVKKPSLLPDFGTETVYFLSPDWGPVISLNWIDVLEKGKHVFDDIPLTIIFTNQSNSKVLFKSLEDEWRAINS